MADRSPGNEAAHPEPRLLPELPSGGGAGELVRLDLPPGELPESAQEAAHRPASDEEPVAPLDRQDRRPHGRLRGPRGPGRQGAGVRERGPGPAERGERALPAPGLPGKADRLSELHQRLVERAGRVGRHPGLEGLAEPSARARAVDRGGLGGEPGPDAEPVRLQREDGLAVREARDGRRGVVADPRQGAPRVPGPGKAPSPVGHDRPGRRVQVARPRVVARALPCLQHRVEVGGREGLDRREPVEEPPVVRDGLGDAGLLQEDLRDPDRIRLPAGAPREGAAGLREPVEKPRDHAGIEPDGRRPDGCRAGHRRGRARQGLKSREPSNRWSTARWSPGSSSSTTRRSKPR